MTQYPTIYRIDVDHAKLEGTSDTAEIVKTIVASFYKKRGSTKKLNASNLNQFSEDNKEYVLYLVDTSTYESDWKKFLPDELIGDLSFEQQNLALLLLIKTEFDTFCIIGGKAFQIIVPFIDHTFGLTTYGKISEPSEDDLISINSRGMTGFLTGARELFRDDFKVRDYIKFGKIADKIQVKLSEKTSQTYFKFLQNSPSERIQIEVASGIKIKKGLDFEALKRIVSELDHIKALVEKWDLSSYKTISYKPFINETLKPVLERKIFDDAEYVVSSKEPIGKRFEFDFCNPNNFTKFYEADKYILKKNTESDGKAHLAEILDRGEIYNTAIRHAMTEVGNTDFFKFKTYLWNLHVAAIKGDKTTVSSGFMYHISAEIKVGPTSYFFLDSKWYEIQKSFIDDLAEDCKSFLNSYKAPPHILTHKWDKTEYPSEGNYNMSYDGLKGHVVIDAIIAEGIELCDVLIIEDNQLYLVHIKYGFKANLRVLYNQIMIAAKRLRELSSSRDKKVLRKIYKSLINKERSTSGLSEEEFIQLFNRPIKMVLAFASHLDSDLDVGQNIEKYDSNIARYSLVQCMREVRQFSGEVLIKQIPKL